jgi:hypothetical protein
MRCAGQVACSKGKCNTCSVLLGITRRKESNWRIQTRICDDIKMNLKEKGLNDMGVIDLFQDRKKP